jgi:hypothetical protein
MHFIINVDESALLQGILRTIVYPVFFRVSQILRKKGKFVHFLFCGSYYLRFKRIYRDLLWHTITNIISTCFIFGELKMVAKNAKIR